MIATGVEMLYFDTSYLVRLYLRDAGFETVRALAAAHKIASCWHGQAEVLCALHRALREGRLNSESYAAQRRQFRGECSQRAVEWHPLESVLLSRLDQVLAGAPDTTYLRAGDAFHLACAAENGFTEVYSNDRHFLAAAPLFGLKGVNVIPDAPSSP